MVCPWYINWSLSRRTYLRRPAFWKMWVRYATSVNKLVLRLNTANLLRKPQFVTGLSETFTEWVCLNFTSFWAAQSTRAEKKASFLCLSRGARHLRSSRFSAKNQNDLDNSHNEAFANLIVWKVILPKSFWRVWETFSKSFPRRSPPTNQNLKNILISFAFQVII